MSNNTSFTLASQNSSEHTETVLQFSVNGS